MYTTKSRQLIKTKNQFGKKPIHSRDFTRSNSIHDNMCPLGDISYNNTTSNLCNLVFQKYENQNDIQLYLSMKNDVRLTNDFPLWMTIFQKEFGITKGNIMLDNFVSLNSNKTIFEYYMFKKYNNKIIYYDFNNSNSILEELKHFTDEMFKSINLDDMKVFNSKFGLKIHYNCDPYKIVKNAKNVNSFIRSQNHYDLLPFKDDGKVLKFSRYPFDIVDQISMFSQEFSILLSESKDGIRINIVGLKDAFAFNNWVLFFNLIIKEFMLKRL